jgi:hypothetical protein
MLLLTVSLLEGEFQYVTVYIYYFSRFNIPIPPTLSKAQINIIKCVTKVGLGWNNVEFYDADGL